MLIVCNLFTQNMALEFIRPIGTIGFLIASFFKRNAKPVRTSEFLARTTRETYIILPFFTCIIFDRNPLTFSKQISFFTCSYQCFAVIIDVSYNPCLFIWSMRNNGSSNANVHKLTPTHDRFVCLVK